MKKNNRMVVTGNPFSSESSESCCLSKIMRDLCIILLLQSRFAHNYIIVLHCTPIPIPTFCVIMNINESTWSTAIYK